MINLYDSEILKIEQVLGDLKMRAVSRRNYEDFDREIKEKLAEAGFVATVHWFTAAGPDNVQIPDMLMPEVTIDGRIATDGSILGADQFTFDHDRQVHEVTRNLLELPDQDGVIKTGSIDAAHREILDAHKNHKH